MVALDPDKETPREAASSAGENISQEDSSCGEEKIFEEPQIPDGEG